MTRTTNARVAGFTLLFYIAAGVTAIAQHATAVRLTVVLALLQGFSALVFEVALALWLLIKGVATPAPRQGVVPT